MEMQKLYLLVPLAPLIGAMIAGLFCRHHSALGGSYRDHRRRCHRLHRFGDDLQGCPSRTHLQRPGLHLADQRRLQV